MFSSTELLPLDCDPTTAIWGRSMGFWTYVQVSVLGPIVAGAVAVCAHNVLLLL